jgi:predicted component of viral defense system (DUF524 family)
MKSLPTININLDSVELGLRLFIDVRQPGSLFDAEESAAENNEARYQLVEGCFYDYEINHPDFVIEDPGYNIVQPRKRKPELGIIAPNIFVGTLEIPVIQKSSGEQVATVEFEVQSIKSGYRDDYRDMLEYITEKCTDLLLQANSPVSQRFEVDFNKDSQTIYQMFAFIKSVIGTDEFSEAVHRIVTSPVTRWKEIPESRDIRNAKRFSNAGIKEVLKGGNRTKLPETNYLRSYGIETLPERIASSRKTDSVDTPENRFIKHALETFLKFSTDINTKAKDFGHRKMENESEILVRELEGQLHHSIFKSISRPTTLKLNSPVLQRKEGYREVLRVWLMFDLAAKLIWSGGDDIYSGGKKDIATLYEYWLFFKLLDLFQSIFQIEPKDISELIKETPDGLNLQIKQGEHTALQGIFEAGPRKLNIRFNYNRSFSGLKNYPESGSWTTTLRPDYTLTFWPVGIKESEAEKQELIIHIHFDAKYKVTNLFSLKAQITTEELNIEKKENRKGVFKNADLLKMHAYKDAIRRTGGAYVLYPGDKAIKQKGFHEIIPGLGAFPVRPSKKDDGIADLKVFILDILEHFIDRGSQREKVAFRAYDIYLNPPDNKSKLKEPLPELIGENRALIPDETFVLVGFFNTPQHYEWIKTNMLYNFRMGTGPGSLILNNETVSSKYLLLHTKGDLDSGNLWKIVSAGPKVYSKEDLIKKSYPKLESEMQDYYLVIQVEPVTDIEFKNVRWEYKQLKNYSTGRASAIPFTTSLTELMKTKTK